MRRARSSPALKSIGWHDGLLALGCALAAALLYLPALQGDFVWDDNELLLKNEGALAEWRDAGRSFVEPGPIGAVSGYYRPILVASYVADRRFSGLDPRAFHRTNLLLHALNTAAVWVLLYTLFRRRSSATFGALIFAVHPMQAQAVALITGRNDLLLVVPAVLTLLAHDRWTRTGGRRDSFLAVMFVAYALALWTKETALLLPFALLASEWLLHGVHGKRLVSRGMTLCTLGLVALLYALSRRAVFGSILGSAEIEGAPWRVRSLQVVASIGYYVRHALLPYGFSATPYEDAMLRIGSAQFLLAAFFCLLLVAGLVLAWKRKPLLAFGVVLFGIGLLPVSGVVPMKLLILEHRAYLPMVGAAIVASAAFHDLGARRAGRVAVPAVAVLAVGSLAFLTSERIPVYRTSLSLWESAVRQVPESPYARYSLGYTLSHAGRFSDAIPHLEKAVELRPSFASARRELARSFDGAGRGDEAIEQLESLVRSNPRDASGYLDLAVRYSNAGDEENARRILRQGIAEVADPTALLRRLKRMDAGSADTEGPRGSRPEAPAR